MDDCEHSLAVLTDEIGAKVNQFISRLQECSHTHWNISGSVIKKNISRICQDQARLQEVCRAIESLMLENDPFSFLEVSGVNAALPFFHSFQAVKEELETVVEKSFWTLGAVYFLVQSPNIYPHSAPAPAANWMFGTQVLPRK